MCDHRDTDLKKWVQSWRKAAPALAAVRKRELQAVDYYEKNREILDEMLQYAAAHAEVQPTSGLVEQQRLFMKLKGREGAPISKTGATTPNEPVI
jgi:hypothetical protein